ncbi:c-type cytochrome [Brevirhabdus sp.]|uniref:c-type cytochrome n=1 Tax=Brevirhabdus sp. TaxID=2004514 RepID=UPI004059DB31
MAEGFFTLKGHGGPIKGIAVSPEGDSILTASFDYSVGLWRDGRPSWLEAHRAAANTVLYLDADTAVSGGDDFDLYRWDLTQGRAARMTGHRGKIIQLALSPDRRWLASASWDGTVGLWDLHAPASAPPRLLRGHDGAVNDVAFSGDGRTLYSASADGTIRQWDTPGGRLRRTLIKHGFGVNVMVLNPRANWLAYGAVDGVTRVIETSTGRQIADFTLDRRPILALAARRDYATLAVGDGEGYIMLIDTQSWTITRDFRAALRGPVWALAFSADGRNIHAGGLDDALYSWPVAGPTEGPVEGPVEGASEGDTVASVPRPMVSENRSFLRDPDKMSNGERQFQRKCSICHTLGEDTRRRAGPALGGLFGRRAGSVPGYAYSPDLAAAAIVWDEDTIDALFDLGPDHYIPGSKMPMQRITDPQDRRDLIAFLKEATDTKGMKE